MKALFVKPILTFILLVMSPMLWANSAAQQAQLVIKETIDQVLKDPDKLDDSAWVDHLVDNVFDFQRMSKFVLGQNWKNTPTDQQEAFTKEFRVLLVRTYSTSLKKAIASGVKFEVSYLQPAGEAKRPKIKTIVKQSNKEPIAVDYDMYFINETWKVYNVTVEGVSLVTNYQNEFETDIRTVGMEGLIKKLKGQNQQKSTPSSPPLVSK